jgi:hypothetical protein
VIARGAPDNPARDHFREGWLGFKFTAAGLSTVFEKNASLQIRAIISGKLFLMAGPSRSMTVVFTGPLLGELTDETDYFENSNFRDDRSITCRGRGTFRARRRLKHTTF